MRSSFVPRGIYTTLAAVANLLLGTSQPLSQISEMTSNYHLSSSKLPWRSGSNYCRNICVDSLASIHSAADHQQTIETIKSSCLRDRVCPKDIWIGLYYSNYDKIWRWADYTQFDFGNPNNTDLTHVSPDNPWISTLSLSDFFPNEFSCIYINSEAEFKWDIRSGEDCEVSESFMCNACCTANSTRYTIIENVVRTYDEAESVCQQEMRTNLISIHSEDQYIEAKLLCLYGTSGNSDCWTGLKKTPSGQYAWSDGTEWDYANDTNWYPFHPEDEGRKCVSLRSEDDYLLRTDRCSHRKRVLCNNPDSTFSTINPRESTANSTIFNITISSNGGTDFWSTDGVMMAVFTISIFSAVLCLSVVFWMIVAYCKNKKNRESTYDATKSRYSVIESVDVQHDYDEDHHENGFGSNHTPLQHTNDIETEPDSRFELESTAVTIPINTTLTTNTMNTANVLEHDLYKLEQYKERLSAATDVLVGDYAHRMNQKKRRMEAQMGNMTEDQVNAVLSMLEGIHSSRGDVEDSEFAPVPIVRYHTSDINGEEKVSALTHSDVYDVTTDDTVSVPSPFQSDYVHSLTPPPMGRDIAFKERALPCALQRKVVHDMSTTGTLASIGFTAEEEIPSVDDQTAVAQKSYAHVQDDSDDSENTHDIDSMDDTKDTEDEETVKGIVSMLMSTRQ